MKQKKKKQIIILIEKKKRFNHSNKASKQGKYKWKQKSKKENRDCEIDVARVVILRGVLFTLNAVCTWNEKTKKFWI